MRNCLALLGWCVLIAPPETRGGDVAPATRTLLARYCVDCHGEPSESPERGLSLAASLGGRPAAEAGPAWKKAVDAVEGFEMPPADADQPTEEERRELIAGVRQWLQAAERPGRPVLRRLTRLEYNNTVRDLLGLDTDVYMFPERLPFEKDYFRPETGKLPVRLRMKAREYGGKYPVLLPRAGLPGDSRAEHGFSNRGDAQNTSAVRLEQYLTLARQIMRSPEVTARGWRLQEIFPEAKYEPPVPPTAPAGRLALLESVNDLAPAENVVRDADGNAYSLSEFRARMRRAFSEDRGGVYNAESNQGATVAGKGGVIHVAYGENAARVLKLNPSEDIWIAAFATAEESSGDALLANRVKGRKKFFFGISGASDEAGEGVGELGLVLLSRRGQSGLVRVSVDYGGQASDVREVRLAEGAGRDNTFVSFRAPPGRTIRRLLLDGEEFSGDYVLLDDLAFITREAPAGKQALVGVELPVDVDAPPQGPTAGPPAVDLSLARRPPQERLALFMRRAFRRPVAADEVRLFLGLYEAAETRGASPEDAMRETLAGVLASPHFLYVNLEPRPEHAAPAPDSPAAHRVSDHQLASRLSYFLWSSMPDDELLELADSGRLNDPDVLEAQARRMLKSTAIRELSENFFVEWLKLRELWSAQPDRREFSRFYSGPQGKETLADDMFGEALLLFETVLVEDRPVTDLLAADYTYVNAALAERLYEFGDFKDLPLADSGQPIGSLGEQALDSAAQWYRVRLPDAARGGVITMGASLTLTSFPTRTSPIKRGVWLLETLYNRPPSPPAFAVADIDEQDFDEELSVRQKTSLHRDQPACAVCHNRIDPPGFALESFDGVGRRREKDGQAPIDDSGSLPGAGPFHGPAEFKRQVLRQEERFVRGLTEKLLSYALGRKLEYFDDAAVERIVHSAAGDDYRLSRIIVEIVRSRAFREVAAE